MDLLRLLRLLRLDLLRPLRVRLLVSALAPPSPAAGATPLPTPGSSTSYAQGNGRSTTQRSFGTPDEPAFRPVYQGQAWPTQQPTYTPPPPLDWHQQQARAYTPVPPQKANKVIGLAAIVALIVGLIAGAGAAAAVVALDRNGVVDDQAGPPVGQGADPKVKTGSVASIAQALLPSVVQLKVEGADNSNATGSGFVIDNSGHILTNNHVVSAAASGGSIQVVTQKGKTSTARLVGRSPAYDLAVVQVVGVDAPSVQFGRVREGARRAGRGGDRFAARPGRHGHLRHRLGQEPPGHRRRRRRDLLHQRAPDRRGHQPRQLGRPAGRHGRRA